MKCNECGKRYRHLSKSDWFDMYYRKKTNRIKNRGVNTGYTSVYRICNNCAKKGKHL